MLMTLLKKEVAFSHKALLNNFVPINFWRQSKTSNVLWSTFEELSSIFRSSRSQMFYKIVVLENFAKLTGKHLSWSVFLIKLKAFNFNKKTLQHRCFPVNFAKFLRTSCSQNTTGWLLLYFHNHSLYLCVVNTRQRKLGRWFSLNEV